MAKFTVSIKSRCHLKISLCFVNATAEFLKCSVFLENLEKHFCDLTYTKKNFVKHIENLSQH